MSEKQYGDRCPQTLDEKGGYYLRHAMAMTVEGLHCKHDIAAELAHRDYEIDKLKVALRTACDELEEVCRDPEGEYRPLSYDFEYFLKEAEKELADDN